MRAYNVFRSNGAKGLCCAVPEDCSVPAFVAEPGWAFAGKLDGASTAPLGFDQKAAVTGVRFNGFYLFASFRPNGQLSLC
jgi:hypothetical protein